MKTEYEAKFLDIKPDAIRRTLADLGAILVHPEVLMRRKNFDFPDWRLEENGAWVRVRDEGDKVTLSFKQLIDRTLEGTKEAEVIVSDFETACLILDKIGLRQKAYQETKREKWTLNGSEVTIDTWPWVPSFLEIEACDEKTVEETASMLGLSLADAKHGSVEVVYQNYYDVSEHEIDHCPVYTFGEVPEWLYKARKPGVLADEKPVR